MVKLEIKKKKVCLHCIVARLIKGKKNLRSAGISNNNMKYQCSMKNSKGILFFTLTVLVPSLIIITGCKKIDVSLPTVVTNEVVVNSGTSATGSGTVTSDGNTELFARGLCWSDAHIPALSHGDQHTFDGAQEGTFVTKIQNLTPGKKYYLRAYASNRLGTVYGSTVEFNTGP